MPSTELEPDIPAHDTGRRWSPSALIVAALLGIVMAFYHGLWWPGLVLVKRDAMRFFLPIKQYLAERLSAGELPQWFPYDALGRPFIGATHTGIFHPFTLLYFLLPAPDAYRTSTLLSCLLAAFGAFTLGRRLNFSSAGALLAGVAFALSGYVVSLTDNLVYLYLTCALPLFCAGIEMALVKSRAWAVAPAVVWATVFLNGDAQTGYYYGFIALLWMGMRASGSYREVGLRLVLTGILAVLLAGVQLGPAAEVFASSNRAQAALFHEQVFRWSTHPLRLITLLASPVGADADPTAAGRFFFGSPNYGLWAESIYLGIPVMGLAFLGARQRRDLRVLALLGSNRSRSCAWTLRRSLRPLLSRGAALVGVPLPRETHGRRFVRSRDARRSRTRRPARGKRMPESLAFRSGPVRGGRTRPSHRRRRHMGDGGLRGAGGCSSRRHRLGRTRSPL